VTSKGRTSITPEEADIAGVMRELALLGFRTVAKTWKPRKWNSWQRAAPRPPGVQPVMRTVLRGEGIAERCALADDVDDDGLRKSVAW
jgi:hypothetical protein